jgi:hypothetical protein
MRDWDWRNDEVDEDKIGQRQEHLDEHATTVWECLRAVARDGPGCEVWVSGGLEWLHGAEWEPYWPAPDEDDDNMLGPDPLDGEFVADIKSEWELRPVADERWHPRLLVARIQLVFPTLLDSPARLTWFEVKGAGAFPIENRRGIIEAEEWHNGWLPVHWEVTDSEVLLEALREREAAESKALEKMPELADLRWEHHDLEWELRQAIIFSDDAGALDAVRSGRVLRPARNDSVRGDWVQCSWLADAQTETRLGIVARVAQDGSWADVWTHSSRELLNNGYPLEGCRMLRRIEVNHLAIIWEAPR